MTEETENLINLWGLDSLTKRMETELSKIQYTVLGDGNREFLRSVSIPLVESFSSAFDGDDWVELTNDLPDYLDVDSRPTADGGVIIGCIVGVFVFFGSWAASKLLDEIYDAKFSVHVRKTLGLADKKLSGPNAKTQKMLEIGISYPDKPAFILIGIIGDTFDDVLASEQQIDLIGNSKLILLSH